MQVLNATYPHHAKDEPNRKRYFRMEFNTNNVRNTEAAVEFLKNLQMTSRPSMFQYILNIHI